MKKRIFLWLIAGMLLTGCGKSDAQAPVNDTSSNSAEISVEETDKNLADETNSLPNEDLSSEELLAHYLENPNILETPTREYGESTGYVQLEDDLVARILYPEGEPAVLTEAIENWVSETVAYYQEEALGSSEYGSPAELTAEYDSYLVDNKWISVKITGLFDKPFNAHPISLIATFHANAETGELFTLDDLLTENGRELLQSKVIEDANITENEVDEHLLDLWTLNSGGLEIVLEQGAYLSMSEGIVTLSYSYDNLTDILISFDETVPEITESEIQETETPEEIIIDADAQPEETVTPDKPMVALTFDDGPSKHTDRLLNIFEQHGGKGTFFVVGNILDSRPETLQRMAADGHEIAGHSWNHRQLTKLSSSELTDQLMSTRAKIYELTGVDSTVIRPPYGSYDNTVKNVCAYLGIVIVNWSVDTLDWKYKNPDRIYQTIMNEVKDGDIILCHDLHGTTVDAMERVIPALIAEGYQLVTVTELLSNGDSGITAGSVYNKQ